MVERFADGVWLAELAGLSDPGLVAAQVMEALGVRQAGDVPVIEALRFRLRSAELLLVLDNCEHLLDACAQLAGALLASSPGLRVLATSREPLGVPGEVACPVPPLALPAEGADAVAIVDTPAVRLFLDRGSAARPGAGLAGAPVAVIGRICRELDGLPLAIELAAARTSTLSVEEVETHLADRFRFLAYRRPVADPRHQALQAAIDWSYELLPTAEQRCLRAAVGVRRRASGWRRRRRCAAAGTRPPRLTWWTSWPASRWWSPTRPGARPATGCWRRSATTPPTVWPRHRTPGPPGGATPRRSSRSRSANVTLPSWPASTTTSAPRSAGRCPKTARPGRGWPGRWAASGWPAGSSRKDRTGWNAALATGPADPRLHADLLRLLGMILFHTDPERAEATLSEGCRIATAAGLHAVQARIQVQLSEIRSMLGRTGPEALSECEAAAAVLDAEGDLEGLAEAWIAIGRRALVLRRRGGGHSGLRARRHLRGDKR